MAKVVEKLNTPENREGSSSKDLKEHLLQKLDISKAPKATRI